MTGAQVVCPRLTKREEEILEKRVEQITSDILAVHLLLLFVGPTKYKICNGRWLKARIHHNVTGSGVVIARPLTAASRRGRNDEVI